MTTTEALSLFTFGAGALVGAATVAWAIVRPLVVLVLVVALAVVVAGPVEAGSLLGDDRTKWQNWYKAAVADPESAEGVAVIGWASGAGSVLRLVIRANGCESTVEITVADLLDATAATLRDSPDLTPDAAVTASYARLTFCGMALARALGRSPSPAGSPR